VHGRPLGLGHGRAGAGSGGDTDAFFRGDGHEPPPGGVLPVLRRPAGGHELLAETAEPFGDADEFGEGFRGIGAR
jgi:hypothetical protein